MGAAITNWLFFQIFFCKQMHQIKVIADMFTSSRPSPSRPDRTNITSLISGYFGDRRDDCKT